MQPTFITPTTEAFRLAVAGSPTACLEYPTPTVTGSLESVVVFMNRHRARLEAYAELAGVPLATASDTIRLAAERLNECRELAAERWRELCQEDDCDMSAVYQKAQTDIRVIAFAEAACLTPREAAAELARMHLVRRHFNHTATPTSQEPAIHGA